MLARLRLDADVPPTQGGVALQAGLQGSLRLSLEAYSFALDLAGEAHQRADALPSHRPGPVQGRRHVGEQRAVPVLFQGGPAALDGMVLAVVRWVVDQVQA